MALGVTLVGGGATAGAAPAHPVLVELFTSQGCSSCPAADAFVRELPRLGLGRDRVIPLTFHIDYWDDLGWKDPFAAPEFTERQRGYASSGLLVSPPGEDGIHGSYTPQMIVGGTVHFSGARRDVALAEIQRAASAPEPAALSAEATIDKELAKVTARITTAERPATQQAWRLNVALALKEARTDVRRGENSGETLAEAAIVRWLSPPIPITSEGGPVHIDVPKPRGIAWKDVELVAFVQAKTTGRVIAARALPLESR
ncbi:MAG TPA: DUF1223 domain-containing protein [Polyangia bacterium]